MLALPLNTVHPRAVSGLENFTNATKLCPEPLDPIEAALSSRYRAALGKEYKALPRISIQYAEIENPSCSVSPWAVASKAAAAAHHVFTVVWDGSQRCPHTNTSLPLVSDAQSRLLIRQGLHWSQLWLEKCTAVHSETLTSYTEHSLHLLLLQLMGSFKKMQNCNFKFISSFFYHWDSRLPNISASVLFHSTQNCLLKQSHGKRLQRDEAAKGHKQWVPKNGQWVSASANCRWLTVNPVLYLQILGNVNVFAPLFLCWLIWRRILNQARRYCEQFSASCPNQWISNSCHLSSSFPLTMSQAGKLLWISYLLFQRSMGRLNQALR